MAYLQQIKIEQNIKKEQQTSNQNHTKILKTDKL